MASYRGYNFFFPFLSDMFCRALTQVQASNSIRSISCHRRIPSRYHIKCTSLLIFRGRKEGSCLEYVSETQIEDVPQEDNGPTAQEVSVQSGLREEE